MRTDYSEGPTFLLFARADHPEGWGFDRRAHGYSIIAVECVSAEEEARVKDRLIRPFSGPDGDRQYAWYGGQFDYIGAVFGAEGIRNSSDRPLHKHSYGDNRFFGLFMAEEVLA